MTQEEVSQLEGCIRLAHTTTAFSSSSSSSLSNTINSSSSSSSSGSIWDRSTINKHNDTTYRTTMTLAKLVIFIWRQRTNYTY